MAFWQYRAYDSHRVVHEGFTTSGETFVEMAVVLRQNGLVVIDASKIDVNQYRALRKLQQMKNRLEKPPAKENTPTTQTASTRIRWWTRLIEWLFRN